MRRHRTTLAALAVVTTLGVAGSAAPAAAAPATHDSSHTTAQHPFSPLPASALYPAMKRYRAYVHARIAELVPEVARLTSELGSHNSTSAKSQWLTARLTWLRIGQDNSAYGVFGDLGQHIDGTAAGHQRGVHDPAFTGFHRVEYDLWRRHDVNAAHTDAVRLESYVRQLSGLSLTRVIPSNTGGTNDFVLRVHEVIEDAVRDTLSGDDEYGSGTALAGITADVSATREVLKLLAPKIDARSHGLVAKARRQLSRLTAVASRGRHNGRWIAIRDLPRHQREQVDAAAGAADETLAVVPELLEG